MPEMRWHTWGFEERSFFAAPVDEAAPPRAVQIDGQACTAELCAMIDGLSVRVEATRAGPSRSVDPETLAVVARP